MNDSNDSRIAVLFADVSGSTRLYEEFGDAIARADIDACLKVLSEAVQRFDGRVVKSIGDELMCVFPNALKAALAAEDMQESLRMAGEEERFRSGRLRIKIGWHYGQAEDRRGEVIGEAAIVAQQIIRQARADEILTSGQAYDLMPPDMQSRMHRIEKLNTAVEGAVENIDVYVTQWEEVEEVTQFGGAPAHERPKARSSLLLTCGDMELHIDETRPRCIIGRAANADLHAEGRYTSRHHVEIQYRNGNFHIRDTSANGTIIVFDDGRQVSLRRDQDLLTGSGELGLGEAPGEDPATTVRFRCG